LTLRTTRAWVLTTPLALLLASPLLPQRYRGRFSEDEYLPPPPDANEETEYYFVRLAYQGGGNGYRRSRAWMTDSPAADRHFLQGVRRLTNIHARSMEKYLRPLDPEIFNHPWIYAVEVGYWHLNPEEAAHMREYLLRGGFLVVDDFHGAYEWEGFFESMQRVFPDRPIVEIEPTDAVFHVLYDVDQKVQIPGIQYLRSGNTFEKDGVTPHWRGIYDDQGRLLVAINFNMDLGDAWEHADLPQYPEHWTALAYRFGINYIIYAMTH
jgi:hypothetical protein